MAPPDIADDAAFVLTPVPGSPVVAGAVDATLVGALGFSAMQLLRRKNSAMTARAASSRVDTISANQNHLGRHSPCRSHRSASTRLPTD